MPLIDLIEESFKGALKTQDKTRISILRMLRAALKNKQVERRGPLDDMDVLAVIRVLVRQGKESIEQFEKGGRQDLAAKEKAELEILKVFLPSQASETEIDQILEQVIQEVQALGIKDMGKVMKTVMTRLAGRADGQTIQSKVRQKLSAG
jgi:uncharacterized protein